MSDVTSPEIERKKDLAEAAQKAQNLKRLKAIFKDKLTKRNRPRDTYFSFGRPEKNIEFMF